MAESHLPHSATLAQAVLVIEALVAAIRGEHGVSMLTCSGALHSAVGTAEHFLAHLDGALDG